MSTSNSATILFIQGGGEDGYNADKPMVAALQQTVGNAYKIVYPELQSDESAPDFGWIGQIKEAVINSDSEIILVGHSLGASLILKYLTEQQPPSNIKGIFLISTPYWTGNEDWKQGLILHEDFANELPNSVPLFFYQCKDDDEVPFSHFESYQQQLFNANFRIQEKGGHQFDDHMQIVANDIKAL